MTAFYYAMTFWLGFMVGSWCMKKVAMRAIKQILEPYK